MTSVRIGPRDITSVDACCDLSGHAIIWGLEPRAAEIGFRQHQCPGLVYVGLSGHAIASRLLRRTNARNTGICNVVDEATNLQSRPKTDWASSEIELMVARPLFVLE